MLDQEILRSFENRTFIKFFSCPFFQTNPIHSVSLNFKRHSYLFFLRKVHVGICLISFVKIPILVYKMLKLRRPSFKEYPPRNLYLLYIYFNTTLPSTSSLSNSDFQLQSYSYYSSYTACHISGNPSLIYSF